MARPGGLFSPSWYYQLPTGTKGGPLVPDAKPGLKEMPFSPGFMVLVSKPGLKGLRTESTASFSTSAVQQGNTMNTRFGAINVPPATLFVIPTVFQLVVLVVYDRFIVPFLRKKTGYVGGVTHLQRIGIGFVAAIMASGVAAIVEMKRKSVAE